MRQTSTPTSNYERTSTPTGGGRGWRALVGVVSVALGAFFLAELISHPSKRNIEALIGLIFVGLGIQAPMIVLCAFAILLLPYPMHTSVGTTASLMIFAVSGLTIARSREFSDAPLPQDKATNLWLGAFLLMVVISAYQISPEHYGPAATRYVGLAAAIALYYLVTFLIRRVRDLEIVLKAYMLSAFTVGVVSTLQTLFPSRNWLPPIFQFAEKMADVDTAVRGELRVYASLQGISPFAEFVATSIIIMFVLARRSRSLYERGFWIVGILLLLTGLAGSATRMGVIALLFGFGVLLTIGAKTIPRWQILNVLFVAFALFVLSYAFISPLTATMEERLSSLGTEDSSSMSRWGVMEQAAKSIPDSPVFGHGIYTPPKTFRGGVGSNIHSLYLTLPYLFGIPALVFFLMFAIRLILAGVRWANDMRIPQELREYTLALVTVAITTMFYEATTEFITHAQSSHFFWLRLGLLAAAIGLCRQAVQVKPQESE